MSDVRSRDRAMAQSPVLVADSSAIADVAPLCASFLRHLHAENRTPATRTTYAKAIDQLATFLAVSGMPSQVEAIRREHIEHFLVALHERGMSEPAWHTPAIPPATDCSDGPWLRTSLGPRRRLATSRSFATFR